jgi:hypothetical protein
MPRLCPAVSVICLACACAFGSTISGRIVDAQGGVVSGATLALDSASGGRRTAAADREGRYEFSGVERGAYRMRIEAPGFAAAYQDIRVLEEPLVLDIVLSQIAEQHQSVVIAARTLDPEIDLRNGEVFHRTLFSRDDQLLQQLSAGIDAGQHEGGGKSLEIRRFGFNLDHGGVNGGLKVLVDDVQQNQGTQGHGQGYLGALKALSPELIQEVAMINGPFSPEYGDFSGLGVVHIRQRESLPQQFTARLQGGTFHSRRGFFAYSPNVPSTDAYIAYEGSYTDGPFVNPGRYRRDNVNANYTRSFDGSRQKLGIRAILGRNNFYASGQIPLDLVSAGALDRFGYVDSNGGGRVKLGTVSAYYSKVFANSDTLKIDGFAGRSLFDLYSNFTFFLNDPARGDAFQQHDSRLQEGANAQYAHFHRLYGAMASFTAGVNYHDNQINVGLYPTVERAPLGVTARAHARVSNEAGYAQETVSLLRGRLVAGGGIRFDEFRYAIEDRVNPESSGVRSAGRWQAKANIAFTPARAVPLVFHVNYGRGINSADARGVIQRPDQPRIATTDFYQVGASSNLARFGVSADLFLIDHSHELVYVPDDGSFEFKGPSRAYGFEAKASAQLTRHVFLNGGLTKITNAFYRGGDHRVYVDSAPHLVANAALTVAGWRGWSGSLRMRAINHYRLDGEDPSIVASGHAVFDFGMAKQINHSVELNFGVDNLTNRAYYETQNYFESRVAPDAPAISRIHGTPGYPRTVVAGMTLRLGGK